MPQRSEHAHALVFYEPRDQETTNRYSKADDEAGTSACMAHVEAMAPDPAWPFGHSSFLLQVLSPSGSEALRDRCNGKSPDAGRASGDLLPLAVTRSGCVGALRALEAAAGSGTNTSAVSSHDFEC